MVCVLLSVAFAGSGRAQWRPTRGYQVRDGLAQSQVGALLQDERGYLWAATLSGLSRFDGQRFVTFTTQDGLPDDVISALARGSGGSVLIGTDSGLAARLDAGRITTVNPGHPTGPIVGLAQCKDEVVVASDAGLIGFSLDGRARTIDRHPVRLMVSSPAGRSLVIGSSLQELAPSGVLRPVSATPFPTETIVAAAPDGEAWLLALASGLVFSGPPSGPWAEVAQLPDPSVTALLRATDGTLWVGSARGVWELDEDAGSRQHALNGERAVHEVRALFEDREDNLWVGTWGSGLFQLAGGAFTILNEAAGLPDPTVWAFLEDPPGCAWLATEGSGALHWCEGGIDTRLRPGLELPEGRVMDVALGGDESLWFATAHGLVHRFRSGRSTTFTEADGLPGTYVTTLATTTGGRLWAAVRGGLALVTRDSVRSWSTADGLPDANLRGVAVERSGHLWIATYSAGLVHFDGHRFTRLSTGDDLPHERVWCVTVDSRDMVWAGTDAGIWTRSAAGGTTRVIDLDDGLPSQNVLFLVEDAHGDMWAGTTRGVAVISPVGEVLRTFTTDDGLAGSEGNEGAAMCAADGRLWLGLAEGVSIIDPDRLRANPHPPLVVIEGLTVDGQPWGAPFPTSSGVPAPDPFLYLAPETREVRFDFVALSFTAPRKVRYRFALEGYDERGPTVTEERHVTYRSLPPNRYRFVVEACNDGGVWSSEPLAVSFTIPTRWYQDRKVQVILLLLALGAAIALVHTRLRRERNRQHRLEQQVLQRTAELNTAYRRIAEQNTMLQDLSRTDPLTELNNRRVLAEQLPAELAVLRREVIRGPGHKLASFHGACIYLLDIDGFKQVNDRYGHEVGDRVLAAVARKIESTLREGDLAVRWGGDEIVVLARGIDDAGASRFAQRLLRSISSVRLDEVAAPVTVSASLGFLPYPLSTRDFLPTTAWQRLIEVADKLMYQSKAGGGGRATGIRHDPAIDPVADESDLLDALGDATGPTPRGLQLVTVGPAETTDS